MNTTISTNMLLPNETGADQFISGEHSLKFALSAEANTRQVRAIMVGSTAVKDSTLRLARIISHAYPSASADAPLLQLAVREATKAFLVAAAKERRIDLHERAYLLALHRAAVEMSKFRVYAVWDESGRSEAWRPFELPLIDWVKKGSPDRITFIAAPEGDGAVERKATAAMLAANLFRMERAQEICEVLETFDAC